MDNFDKIIKQKVEQFEVQYNDAHWSEMNEKLNTIRSKKVNTLLFGSAAVITTLIISSYFIFSLNPNNAPKANENISLEDSINKPSTEKTSIISPELEIDINNEKVFNAKTAFEEHNEETMAVESTSAIKARQPIAVKEKTQAVLSIESTKENRAQEVMEPENNVTTQEKIIKEAKLVTPVETRIEEPTKTLETKIEPTPTAIPNSTVNKERRKSVRHKVYADEFVSKKSVKRKQGKGNFFLRFKKRRYKINVSAGKAEKRKKEKKKK